MYNNKVIIRKWEFAPRIPDSTILVDWGQHNELLINFTTDDMRSNYEAFLEKKMDALYLTEIIRIEWIQTLDE